MDHLLYGIGLNAELYVAGETRRLRGDLVKIYFSCCGSIHSAVVV